MTVSNRLKRFKQFKPQSAKNTMGTVLKEKRGSPIRLLPPRDFPHQTDSHPMVHDRISSAHTESIAAILITSRRTDHDLVSGKLAELLGASQAALLHRAVCRKRRCYVTQTNATEFHQCFTCATRPLRHRLTDGLGRHAGRRTRLCPTPARTLASAPDPCARAAQRPPRSARGAVRTAGPGPAVGPAPSCRHARSRVGRKATDRSPPGRALWWPIPQTPGSEAPLAPGTPVARCPHP